jgi:Ca-activated chloride channel homolog
MLRTAPGQPPVPAPVQATDVRIGVTGLVARATVRQEFTNPAAQWAEAVYVFPLPDTAAVDHLTMHVGDRVIEGVIQERQAAKATYERARQEGTRASLVEQERPNVFTTSVANVPPGAAITVEIEYQHVVRYDSGRFHLRFPMAVGPRYVPSDVADAERITPPVQGPAQGTVNPVTLRVVLDAGLPVAGVDSPHHPVSVTPLAAGAWEITLLDGGVPADRDFELMWEPVAGAAPTATLLTEAHGDEIHALVMLMPPAPAAAARARVPREVVFVLDHSGSMGGASIEQAKAALTLALGRLGAGDTFNVVRFNHTTESLFLEARAASAGNLRAAERWVEAIRADGGTLMLPALRQALDGVGAPGRLRQVVFLTDGAVGNEAALFEEIRARLGASRLFTIGIGSAPNSHFMREAARLGRGTFTFIGNPGEVQDRMTVLFRKLETPALTDVRLELPGVDAAEMLPTPIPDLYLGEPVVVAVKARTLPTRAIVRGWLGLTPWEHDVALHDAQPGAGLAVHWARARIAALLDGRRPGAPDDDVRAAVIGLAQRHHLVSPYTSLVAVDVTPARPADAGLTSHALPTSLPHGAAYEAVSGLGQGASDAPLHLALGLLAVLGAVATALARTRAR